MYLTKRQKQVLDFIKNFISEHGYSPSLEEISQNFDLSSLATAHKHVSNLAAKGVIKRGWNRSRSIELLDDEVRQVRELPLLGLIAAGKPIEAVETHEVIDLQAEFAGKEGTYVLKVKGDSMIEEQIKDGDYVVVEARQQAENGETVVALIDGDKATLKKFYREKDHIRLEPANPNMAPIIVREEDLKIQGVVVAVLRKY